MRKILFALVSSCLFVAQPVFALQLNNPTVQNLQQSKQTASKFSSSVGSVLINTTAKDGSGGSIARCLASVKDRYWLRIASHCVFSQTYELKNAAFVLKSDPTKVYAVDFVVIPKNQTKIKGDGTDRGANTKAIQNDYAMIRLSEPLESFTPLPFCSMSERPDNDNESYFARVLYLGSNNMGTNFLKSILEPVFAVENVAYVTPDQVVSDKRGGEDDIFSRIWSKINPPSIFSSNIEGNIEQGDSGGPTILADKNCQIGVNSYLSSYRFVVPGEDREEQIRSNFSATMTKDDIIWVETVASIFNKSYLEALGVENNSDTVPIIEY